MATMQDMLKRENVQIVDGVKDWRDAVHVAVQPLVDQGYVKSDYIDGIIANAIEFGPYFVICPDFALLHARPEQGVIHQQLAVTVLREPVRFKAEGPDVRLLVVLAAENGDSHIEVMQKLAVMFSNPDTIAKIAESDDADCIYNEFIAPVNEDE